MGNEYCEVQALSGLKNYFVPSMIQIGKFVFCARKICFPSNLRAWNNYPRRASAYVIVAFLYVPVRLTSIFSNFARLISRCAMANSLRVEDLQRALHTFQSVL